MTEAPKGRMDNFRPHDVVETKNFVFIDDFEVRHVTGVKEELLDPRGLHEVTLKFIVSSFTQTNDDGEKIKQPTAKQEDSDNYIVIASIAISLLAMAISVMTMIFG